MIYQQMMSDQYCTESDDFEQLNGKVSNVAAMTSMEIK